MRLIITVRTKIIYSMYSADEVSVHRACYERTTQPYSLGGGGTIYPGSRPAYVTTRSLRMVAEYLLTRSMLITMYYHFMVCACICTICIYSQSISYRRLLSLFSLSNCINVFVWHNSSFRKHEYESVTTITIQFGESLLSKPSSSELLLLHTSIVHVFWHPRMTQHLRFQTSFRPKNYSDWERAPPSIDLQSSENLDLNEHLRTTLSNCPSAINLISFWNPCRKCTDIWTWFPSSEIWKAGGSGLRITKPKACTTAEGGTNM